MRQIVLYFGLYRTSMKPALVADKIQFHFEVVDIRDAIPRGLRVEGQHPFEVNMLIALAAGHYEGRTWVSDLSQWEKLVLIAGAIQAPERRSDCLLMVEVFAALRELEYFVSGLIERYKAMPVDVNIEHTRYAKNIHAQGIGIGYGRAFDEITGELETLRQLMRRRVARLGANETQAETTSVMTLAQVADLTERLDEGEDVVAALTAMGLLADGPQY